MDGIANVAKQQQTQISSPQAQEKVQVAQATQVHKTEDIAKEQLKSPSEPRINTKEDVQDLVAELNKALSPMSTNIKFGVDSQDIFYVSVIESETSKMLRRYPAEQAASFLPKMKEVTGILFDTKG